MDQLACALRRLAEKAERGENVSYHDVRSNLLTLVQSTPSVLPLDIIFKICDHVLDTEDQSLVSLKRKLRMKPALMAFCGRTTYELVVSRIPKMATLTPNAKKRLILFARRSTIYEL